MDKNRLELIHMIKIAYSKITDNKFNDFRQKLLTSYKDLNGGSDYIKTMLTLRSALLQADLSLSIKNRISKLPIEYRNIYYFIEPQLKEIDSQVLDKYTHYGFIPLKFGNTIKYP